VCTFFEALSQPFQELNPYFLCLKQVTRFKIDKKGFGEDEYELKKKICI
jgi:hypothetical protein